jgi:hypothetical protein
MNRNRVFIIFSMILMVAQLGAGTEALADGASQRVADAQTQLAQLKDLQRQLGNAHLYRDGAITVSIAASLFSVLQVGLGQLAPIRRVPGHVMGYGFNPTTNYSIAAGSAALAAGAMIETHLQNKDIETLNREIGAAEAADHVVISGAALLN